MHVSSCQQSCIVIHSVCTCPLQSPPRHQHISAFDFACYWKNDSFDFNQPKVAESWLIHNKQKSLSAMSVNATGVLLSELWKFLILSLAHSTWMRRFAIHLVWIYSFSESWDLPHRKGGIFKWATIRSKSSSLSNPLSAMTVSFL